MSQENQSTFISNFFTIVLLLVMGFGIFSILEGRSNIKEDKATELLKWGNSTPELSKAFKIVKKDGKITNDEFKALNDIRVKGLLNLKEPSETKEEKEFKEFLSNLLPPSIFLILIVGGFAFLKHAKNPY